MLRGIAYLQIPRNAGYSRDHRPSDHRSWHSFWNFSLSNPQPWQSEEEGSWLREYPITSHAVFPLPLSQHPRSGTHVAQPRLPVYTCCYSFPLQYTALLWDGTLLFSSFVIVTGFCVLRPLRICPCPFDVSVSIEVGCVDEKCFVFLRWVIWMMKQAHPQKSSKPLWQIQAWTVAVRIL